MVKKTIALVEHDNLVLWFRENILFDQEVSDVIRITIFKGILESFDALEK